MHSCHKGQHSHMYMLSVCRCICNRAQNKSSDWCSFRSWSKCQDSEWLISTNHHIFSGTKEAWLHFCPLNPCKIKRSGALEGNDQAIKDDFYLSRFLIPITTLLWAVCKGLHLSRSCDHTCGLSTRLPTQRGRGSLVQLHSESHYGIVLA